MISLFIPAFIQIRFLDVLDILFVAILFYQLYLLIRGTGAMNIFLGILSIYLLWWLVRIFEMELLTAILGQFISVGVLALIIVFQPEIRKFLLLLGKRSFTKWGSGEMFKGFWTMDQNTDLNIVPIVNALESFAEQKTGALIVITGKDELESFLETGQKLEAQISEQLLGSIFFKNSPLHDGAVIISGNRIKAARCVLPVSEVKRFPVSLGLRHRAALGVSEQTDAIALIVSEQTGNISWCKAGEIKRNIKPLQLKELLAKEFLSEESDHQTGQNKKSFFKRFLKNRRHH
jgi:diadenylate cyclase